MKIKVCGMRDPENIHAVKELGIDFWGLIFWPKSSRYVKDITVKAGNIPDIPTELGMTKSQERQPATVGVFVNEMPQTVVTHVYNYKLDYIQLHGEESPTYIDNLKRTLIPDIMSEIKVIKALSIREADDVKRWRQYKDHTDLILFDTKCDCVGGSGKQFDWSVLEGYDGDIPFLLSGGIGPKDAERVKRFSHPMCIGIDINSRFEIAPAMKDISKLRTFINEIQQQ